MNHKIVKKIACGIGVLILLVAIAWTNGKERTVSSFESIVNDVLMIPQNGFAYLRHWISGNDLFFQNLEELQTENQALQAENQELKEKMMDYEILASENRTLKEQARIQELYLDYDVLIADVISDAANNWEEVYVINKGSEEGVQPNMTVMTMDGLVGYIESVAQHTAKVVSILDAGNAVSSRVTRTRDLVICKGDMELKMQNQLKVISLPIGLELLEGDKIETSGMGGIYPKGIAIGEVESFTNKANPLENEAVLKTYVDFNKLEVVAVIISPTTPTETNE